MQAFKIPATSQYFNLYHTKTLECVIILITGPVFMCLMKGVHRICFMSTPHPSPWIVNDLPLSH